MDNAAELRLVCCDQEVDIEGMVQCEEMSEVPFGDEDITVFRTISGWLFAVDTSYLESAEGPVFDPVAKKEVIISDEDGRYVYCRYCCEWSKVS